jgi:Predicted transcriptional regulators
VEFDNAAPIWRQLVREFARRIATGQWAEGERVPGVRELADQLGVNPNTVQRAMAELERDGLCKSERTAGRYVSASPAQIEQLRGGIAGEAANEYVNKIQGLQMNLRQAKNLVQEAWTDDRGQE